ncbi:hypothetical protein [Ideonella sp.]|uniref:hypothetical protein n=1 Tax=Ideonella sp. TaxID=1929293 RepID=UPI0035B21D0A
MAETKAAPVNGVHPVRLVGRIEDVRRTNGQSGAVFLHLVKLPAADQFSSPATVLVRSEQRCGEAGAVFDQLVQIGGYARSYQVTDDESGRKVTRRTADNTLSVVG